MIGYFEPNYDESKHMWRVMVIHAYIHTYIHTNIYIYIYTYIYTHTYTHMSIHTQDAITSQMR